MRSWNDNEILNNARKCKMYKHIKLENNEDNLKVERFFVVGMKIIIIT